MSPQTLNTRRLLVTQEYEAFVKAEGQDLLHTFRLLYQLLRLIEEAPPGIAKDKYARLIRAQMSLGELKLLIYNALSSWGASKLFPLVEKYDMLQHLSDDLLTEGWAFCDARFFPSYATRPAEFIR